METKNDEVGDQIDNLIREFSHSSDPKQRELAKIAEQLQRNHKKFEKTLSNLQESLDYLRICVKYQVFDLEATRRENTYLRKLLEGGFDDEELIG